MSSCRPSKFARQSMRTNAVSFASSTATTPQNNPTSRSVASRSSRLGIGASSRSRQGTLAMNCRNQRLNQAKTIRGQHSRAATVASIQGLMNKGEGFSRPQEHVPNLTIQVKPNQTFEMSQLSEEGSSNGSSSAMSSNKNQFSSANRGDRGWSFRNTKASGRFLRTNMNGSIMTKDRARTDETCPLVYTKLVETPEGARSFQNRRKSSSENTDFKTPRHRNGGRDLSLRSSQQSFATASLQDDRCEQEAVSAYSLAQGSTTMNGSSSSLYGNSSFGNVDGSTSIPAAADLAKTMKSEMDSCMLWFDREQKKLQNQHHELTASISEGQETIKSCLSKSMKEASDHGSSVVASIKKSCDTVEEVAKKAIAELNDRTEQAKRSSKETVAKMEHLSSEAKAQVAEVKLESKLAHSLYEKATSVLKTVQASGDFVQSFFKKSSKALAQRPSGAMIESDAPVVKHSTPVRSARDQGATLKPLQLDGFIIIEDISELENISPLTMKSHRCRPNKKPKQAATQNNLALQDRTSLENIPTKPTSNYPKRATPSPGPLENKPPRMPMTPSASIPASNSIAPKLRRLTNSKESTAVRGLKSMQVVPTKMTRSFHKGNESKVSKPVDRKSKTTKPSNYTVNSSKPVLRAKPIRKNRGKKRSNIVREIDFSLP